MSSKRELKDKISEYEILTTVQSNVLIKNSNLISDLKELLASQKHDLNVYSDTVYRLSNEKQELISENESLRASLDSITKLVRSQTEFIGEQLA